MVSFEFNKEFSKFSYQEKKNYLRKIFKTIDLNTLIINIINEIKIDEVFKIINDISKYQSFKRSYKVKTNKVISLVINIYVHENRTKELYEYLTEIKKNDLKLILDYEIQNKTIFSKTKICKALVYELKSHLKTKKKTVEYEESFKKKSILQKEIKSKKVKFSIGTIIVIILFVFSYISVGYIYSIILFYNNHVYPNTYLNNKLIEGESLKDISLYLDSYNDKLTNSITLIDENNNHHEYLYKDIGIYTNTFEIKEFLNNQSSGLNGFEKLSKLFLKTENKLEVKYLIDKEKYETFLIELQNKVNVKEQNESFKIVNGNISYQKGVNGFLVNTTNLENELLSALVNNQKEIKLTGEVVRVNDKLNVINKKVSTFTTYYNELQGRAKNIKNAVSKLNGKILYPNDIFSFYKTVGPYNGTKGYIFYDKDVGSGVCQVSTTIYNNVLLLNLDIVSRYNHGEMVYYVDYGLDATVYGSSVDFKFKNDTNYPIYIEATANNGVLTISFWSNENIIKPGYSYKPRTERINALAYRTYLDTYYLDKVVGSTYLDTSVYIKGK